ncbi:polyphosphate:AMP phosphotransferase [soil metagenome]
MLETIDLKKKIDKDAYLQWFPRLKTDLRELQQHAREANFPIIVLFEGLHMAGKADSLKHLGEALDPRGFSVHTTDLPSEEELQRHWLWRFWVRMPERGKIGFFERSWYTRVLEERVDKVCARDEWEHAYTEINQTEEMLTRDGVLLIKFWLHLSSGEQKKRLKAAAKDPYSHERITKRDWRIHDQYDKYVEAVEEMVERTSTHFAPWVIVEADNARFRRMKIFQTICEAIAGAINKPAAPLPKTPRKKRELSVPVLKEMPTILDNADLTKTITTEDYELQKVELQMCLRRAQQDAIARGHSLAIVYEGWDASGKGGSIRRLTATLDPRYYDVIAIGKPTPEDHAHHYLWRFWRKLPKRGNMTIFDRSWYGRVLVERIEGFCSEESWQRAYQEINEFEMQLFRSGISLVKFWIHISPEEQLRRFKAREADPHKAHKMTDEDWRNRDKWDAYRTAVDDMVKKTSTTYAPWTIIEGDCKRYARVHAMTAVCKAWQKP